MCLRGLSTGLYYNYQHLSKRNYSAGKRVERGTVIAQMGNTGSSTTGTHLHFAIGTGCSSAGFIPKNAEALNPMSSLFSWVFKANDKPTPKPTPVPSKKFTVNVELPGYMSATDAKGRRNARVRVKAGSYDIFNTSQGMVNVTKKAGTAGSWINPADNIVGEKLKSNTEIAKEVIAGKWGNGSERIKRLTSAGYDARAIQTTVNKLLK